MEKVLKSILKTIRLWSAAVPMNIVASAFLFLMALLAAVAANSSFAPAYNEFLSHQLYFQVGDFNLFSHNGHSLTVHQFINDGLMTVFFLTVGLEIKRELLVGELSSVRKALLPFIAACGGMIVPVAIYTFICPANTDAGHGLAIPMATDIAFSLGVLSLLGKRVPLSLKIFLTAFAVVDDIGGIMVIAAFYSKHVSLGYLAWAAVLLLMLFLIGKRVSTNKTFFMLIGIVIWYLFLQSGIHSTIAGVLLAFVIPARPRLDVGKYIERIRRTINMFPVTNEDEIVLTNRQIAMLKRVESASDRVISPLQSLEDNLHLAVNFVILPLFAFANAGVVFSGSGELVGDVTWAIAAGLLFGKFFGIYLFTWLAVKTGIAGMPRGMTWKTTAGVSLLGGIGFTVSLFITNLSFGDGQAVLLNQAKFGVLLGTLVAGMLGFLYLRWALAYDEKKLKH
ncbi:MAG TPA: Na+/H+ antiporter NhaA [Bacteroides graminisolvens]|uniref:Na(+)/H(+) antiporter NhaA n=1 Tax=Bacteroides graminisolvens TaxID=477666 RepID=A0A3D2SI34_9BACE|nr:Na+/H+ antiporter NhaA [Bacteroides graminisolvens]